VDISCKDIEWQCKMIREEIFRHLTIIENIKNSWGQTVISSIFMAFSIIIGVIIGVGSVLQGPLNYAIIISIIITFIVIFIVFYLKVSPTVYIISKFTRRIIKLHSEELIKYMDRYRECCNELSNSCSKEYAIYCLDPKELEELVKELTSRK